MKLGQQIEDIAKTLQEKKEEIKALQSDIAKLEVWAAEISKFESSEGQGANEVNQMGEDIGKTLTLWPKAILTHFSGVITESAEKDLQEMKDVQAALSKDKPTGDAKDAKKDPVKK